MLVRKGRKNQYYIDKINPLISDNQNYNSENFIGNENMFSRFKDSFNDSIEINNDKDKEIKSETNDNITGTKFFESKTCLYEKKKQNLFLKDLQKRRFSQFKSKVKKENKIFKNLQFNEEKFIKKFLKKKKYN